MPGMLCPRLLFQRTPLVSDPGMHHGTCVTHVPWCMSGSLTLGGWENVPGIPGACAPTILRIWQEAYDTYETKHQYSHNLRQWYTHHDHMGPFLQIEFNSSRSMDIYYNMVRWISAPGTMHFRPRYDTFWPCGLFTLLQFCNPPPPQISMKLRWVSSVN